jgi:hypothetical protein
MTSQSGENKPNEALDSYTRTDIKAQLQSALDGLERVGSFASFGNIEGLIDPHVCIGDLGQIKLPLTEESAQSLIKICHQSPFGNGEKTIIDTSVRKSWELNNDQFHLRNPAWKNELDEIAAKALNELGLSHGEICETEAQLYKMLLYEKGAMFKAHKELVW